MLERISRNPWIEILLAMASVIFGLASGSLLKSITDPIFSIPDRAVLAGFLVLSVLMVISTTAVSIFARQRKKEREELEQELHTINRKLGLTVTFVHDPPKRSTGEVYRRAREIIERAKKEILVFSYVYPDVEMRKRAQELETAAYRKEHEKYFEALLAKIREHKGSQFFYRRLVQLPEGVAGKLDKGSVDSSWFGHYRELLDFLKEYPEAAYLKKAPSFLEQNFAIIDERYVIWWINAVDPERQIRYAEGALIFDDPHKEFVRYLKGFFQKVDAHAAIVRRIPEELAS